MRKNKSREYDKLIYQELISITRQLNKIETKLQECEVRLSIKDLLNQNKNKNRPVDNTNFWWYKDL